MAQFSPIRDEAGLPAIGTPETNVLDFKGSIRDKSGNIDGGELAKDVAAFANADGGTLLVGAYEDKKRGVLGIYRPLDAAEVKVVCERYSKAVAQYCSPAPVHDTQRIPKDEGVVVAVNVTPFVGQVVGVRFGEESDAYSFPMRSGIDTVPLRPEQLPMFMLPAIRRVAILLRGIPADSYLHLSRMAQLHSQGLRGTYVGVDEGANVLRLVDNAQGPWTIPLDRIESVWESIDGWHVAYRTWE